MKYIKSVFIRSSILLMPTTMIVSCSNQPSDNQIKNYISSHPEEIVNSVLKYCKEIQKNNEIANIGNIKKLRENLIKSNKFILNPNGKVEIIEVLDFNCGYCKASLPEIGKKLLNEWSDVKLTIVALPLINESSSLAVKIARYAAKRNPNSDTLIKEMFGKERIDEKTAIDVAKKFSIKLSDTEIFSSEISENMKAMQIANIRATPAFIIGNEVLLGYDPDKIENSIYRVRLTG